MSHGIRNLGIVEGCYHDAMQRENGMDDTRDSYQAVRKKLSFGWQIDSAAEAMAWILRGNGGRSVLVAVKQPNTNEPPHFRRRAVHCRSRAHPGPEPDPRQRLP